MPQSKSHVFATTSHLIIISIYPQSDKANTRKGRENARPKNEEIIADMKNGKEDSCHPSELFILGEKRKNREYLNVSIYLSVYNPSKTTHFMLNLVCSGSFYVS